jgi:hypothetical protein
MIKQPSQLEQVAINFVVTRRRLRLAKNLRNSFRCTEESVGDFEAGDNGTPPCFHDPEGELCYACKKRQIAHQKVVKLIPIASKALRTLKSAVDKYENASND